MRAPAQKMCIRDRLHGRVAADDVFDHGGEHLEAVVPDDDALDAGIQIHKAVLLSLIHI